MRDIIFVAVVVGFFALAVVFVRACDLILGHTAELEREREP